MMKKKSDRLSGNALYNCEYIATTKMSTLPNEEFLRYYKEAQDNGGSTVIEFKGNHNKTFEKQNRDTESSTEAVSAPQPPEADGFVQNYGQDMAESIIYVDVLTSDHTACVLMVNTVLTPVSATVDTLRIQMIWITVVMMILSLLIALVISKKVSRSMIRVNNAAKKLAKGEFNVTFDGKDYREIAELSETLNQAADDLGKNEKLQKELIANVSHDLRTPLTMIIAYSEVMRDLPGENTPENVQVVIDEAKRLTNLVNNAVIYTGSDKRVLVRQLVKEQIVRIEVIDSGEGISEENLPYVWDRYYKVDKTHKRAVMGTGLGLSIVKNILELHHAHYGVESIPSAGSKFWFELPVIEKEEI